MHNIFTTSVRAMQNTNALSWWLDDLKALNDIKPRYFLVERRSGSLEVDVLVTEARVSHNHFRFMFFFRATLPAATSLIRALHCRWQAALSGHSHFFRILLRAHVSIHNAT